MNNKIFLSNMEGLEEELIKDLKMDKFSAKDRERYLGLFGQIIEERIIMRILMTLDDKNQEELDKLIKTKKDSKDIDNFLKEKVPNMADIVVEESLRFKREMKADQDKLLKLINK